MSRWLLLPIVLLGLGLRLYGLDWDQGQQVHPDERYVAWVANSVRWPDGLNPFLWPPDSDDAQAAPRSFSYGHFPLYLQALVGGRQLILIGRILSALFDTATIALVFALGRALYGERVGLLGAAWLALTVAHIQQAHFATFDAMMTTWVIAALLFLVVWLRSGRWRWSLVASVCAGLAVSCKFSAVFVLLPLVLAHFLQWEASGRSNVGRLAGSIFVVLLVFALTNPFALLEFGAFVSEIQAQGQMVRGNDSFPFTRQYHGTLPYFYSIEQQVRWGMGSALGIVAFVGLMYALYRAWRGPFAAEEWLPLAWFILYFGFVGALYVKFMRYMLPLLPVLLIYAARFLVECAAIGQNKGRVQNLFWRSWALVGVLVIFCLTALYAFAFVNVYRGEHPWLSFSYQVYAQAPPGSTLALEAWDEPLPLMLQKEGRLWHIELYRTHTLNLYVPDTRAKFEDVLASLADSDYLIVASNRIYGSTCRWPRRYALTCRYYERLFAGDLGFELVAWARRYPALGPLALLDDPFDAVGLPSPLPLAAERPRLWTLNLGRADESLSVYDHPLPLLFKNVGRLAAVEMLALLNE